MHPIQTSFQKTLHAVYQHAIIASIVELGAARIEQRYVPKETSSQRPIPGILIEFVASVLPCFSGAHDPFYQLATDVRPGQVSRTRELDQERAGFSAYPLRAQNNARQIFDDVAIFATVLDERLRSTLLTMPAQTEPAKLLLLIDVAGLTLRSDLGDQWFYPVADVLRAYDWSGPSAEPRLGRFSNSCWAIWDSSAMTEAMTEAASAPQGASRHYRWQPDQDHIRASARTQQLTREAYLRTAFQSQGLSSNWASSRLEAEQHLLTVWSRWQQSRRSHAAGPVEQRSGQGSDSTTTIQRQDSTRLDTAATRRPSPLDSESQPNQRGWKEWP